VLGVVAAALAGVRKAKSEAKVTQRTEVASLTLAVPAGDHGALEAGLGDLRAAGRVRALELVPGDGALAVRQVELVPAPEG
jgi:valyl-tRNA synthetase